MIKMPWRRERRPKPRSIRMSIEAAGETLALAPFTVLTGKPRALRFALDALRAAGAVEVAIRHERGRAVAIAMAHGAKTGGLATIDTIEVGLHHTEIDDAMATLAADARRLSVQVVVTTQSVEVIAAIARLGTGGATEVVLIKCGTGLTNAPTLNAEQMASASRTGIETR